MEMKENQIQFKPTSEGFLGSIALLPNQPRGYEYWGTLKAFLEKIKIAKSHQTYPLLKGKHPESRQNLTFPAYLFRWFYIL